MAHAVISRSVLQFLLFSLAILVTLQGVLGAFLGLANGLSQANSATVLGWVSLANAVLLCVTAVLLLAALTIHQLESDRLSERGREE